MPKEFTVNVKGEPQTFTSPYDTLDEAIEALKASGNRSEFAVDLVTKHERFGLSDKQAAWVHKLAIDKREVREPLRLGLTNIALMLRNKPGKGRPKLEVADGVVVTLNSDKSKNPGHVSVTDGGPYGESVYFGRIDPEGTVHAGRDFTDEVQQALVAFNNQNPQESNDIDDDDLPF
jgi:hypothetical protein